MPSDSDVEDRLDRVERRQERLDEEVRQLRRELKALGVDIPDLSPTGKTPLSPQARLARLRLAAAHARAAKGVGPGVGRVNLSETADRLMREVDQFRRDLGLEDEGDGDR